MSIIPEIAQSLSMPPSWVQKVIARAPYSYKTYYIKKRNGGLREISQPSKETKAIQYWFLDNYATDLNVHSCATAYIPGKNILNNAEAHAGNPYLAKFDFKDFFTSISIEDVFVHLKKSLSKDLTDQDLKMLSRLVCKRSRKNGNGNLTIGAPTSPNLSNSIMFEFDFALEEFCKAHNFVYTRYADDLTISSREKGSLFVLPEFISQLLTMIEYPKLTLNDEKTIFLSKKYQRRVTGLILTNEGNVSLGRDKKREISSLIHKYKIGTLSEEEIEKLQGTLAYAHSVEPAFISRMRKKYGAQLMGKILYS